jgi:hypothetical protein
MKIQYAKNNFGRSDVLDFCEAVTAFQACK